jgi:hypothetical protein
LFGREGENLDSGSKIHANQVTLTVSGIEQAIGKHWNNPALAIENLGSGDWFK